MDRLAGCDRCGADPKYMAVRGLAEVLLCGHHGRVHLAALEGQGWEVWPVGTSLVGEDGPELIYLPPKAI